MKAKAFLLAASLFVAAASTSFAQIFSENAVGYVNVTVPASGYMMLGNPLNRGDNSLNTILPLPDGFDGASVYRFNRLTQAYRDTMQWVTGLGWLASAPEDLILNPGEGFFIQNVTAVPLAITFMGDVSTGITQNPVAGDNKYSMLSAIVPKAGRLGWPGLTNSLEFPACTGDSIYIYDEICQCYLETAQYVDGLGWLHNNFPLEGPFIDVGRSFFIQRICPDRNWTMTFSVGP